MLLDKAESPWSGHRAPTPGKIARFNRNDECDDSGRGVLVALFGREVPEVTGDRADLEALFDRFETLAVLSCAHPADVWFPRCRLHGACFAFWVRSNQTWLDRADVKRNGLSPLAAGVFGGSV